MLCVSHPAGAGLRPVVTQVALIKALPKNLYLELINKMINEKCCVFRISMKFEE